MQAMCTYYTFYIQIDIEIAFEFSTLNGIKTETKLSPKEIRKYKFLSSS